MAARTVLAFGHRGARALAPENTLSGFRLAFDLGADGVELDVHLTADGQVVVLHDPDTRRTTGQPGRVAELTLKELRRLDAGKAMPGAHVPQPIPTLEEVLELARGRGRVAIELKKEAPAAAEPAVRLVQQAGMERDCSFLSFSPALVERVRRLAPEVETELIVVFPWRRTAKARSVEAHGLDLPYQLTTAWTVSSAHAAGLRVGAGIANHEPSMRRLVRQGVDVIYTDRPDLLVQTLRALGVKAG